MDITGTLKNWSVITLGDSDVISGEIHGDTRHRFRDGERVRTSKIDRIEDDIAYTRNSVYKLEPISPPQDQYT